MLKGTIYKIHSPSRPNLGSYIGSTFLSLHRRMVIHRCAHRAFLLGRSGFCAVYRILGCSTDAVAEVLEEVEVDNRRELLRLEGEFIRNVPECVNVNIPGRTCQERYQDNKDEYLEKARDYYRTNIEKKRTYYQKNKARLIARSKARYWARRFEQLSQIRT